MTSIAKGANVAVAATRVRATLSWPQGAGVPDIDGSALLVRANGRVASDDDFVFYNQPRHPGGAVHHLGKQTGTDSVEIDLAGLSADVDRVVLAASADGGTFGQVPGLRLVLTDSGGGADIAEFVIEANDETAMVSGELYRRNEQWKFRAIGQGYASGLAGLAGDFGISVDEAPPPPTPPTPAAAAPPVESPPPAAPQPPPPPPAPTPTPPAPYPPAPAGFAPPAPAAVAQPGFAPPTAPPPPPAGFVPPAFPVQSPPTASPPPPAAPAAPVAPVAPVAGLDAGPVNLVKGARVSLVKSGAPTLQYVTMGLGWDPARGKRSIDLDASAIAFDSSGRALAMAWFTQLTQFGGALQHAGDNLTGKGDGDDEQIRVDLLALPQDVMTLVFTITSYRGHKFTDVANAFCRLVEATSGTELVRFNLSEAQASTGVIMAALRRTGPQMWEMRAIGEFHDGRTVKNLLGPAAQYATAP